MNVTSQLEAVTVYSSGAVCTRRVKAAQAPQQLRIGGLPLSLRSTSLRARVIGGGELRVLDVRAGFDVQLAEEVDVPAEQKALEAAEAEVARLESALARVTKQAQELSALRPAFPAKKKGEPPRAAPVEAMLQLADFVDQQLAAKNVKRRAVEKELEDARNDAQLRRRRLAEASTGKRTERARLSRSAVVTLSAEPKGELELAIEYQVPGARWVPNYELRLDKTMAGGALKMRAAVAQNSGEDWEGVKLSLSTAQLDRRTDLPQLRSLRIGRSQPPAPRSGWREAPQGLDELFEAFDEAMAQGPSNAPSGLPPPAPPPAHYPDAAPSEAYAVAAGPPPPRRQAAPEQMKSLAKSGRPPTGAMLMAAPAPQAARSMPPLARKSRGAFGAIAALGGAFQNAGGGAPADVFAAEEGSMDDGAPMEEASSGVTSLTAPEEALPGLPDAALLDYDRLTMPRAHDPSAARGRLHPASEWEFAFAQSISVQIEVVTMMLGRAHQAASQVEALPLPHHAQWVRESAAAFDYRYECEAKVEVPSTGKWTLVPVTTAQVGLTSGYSCVPAVEPKVYRVLKIANKSAHALLKGPVDVSVGDEFLMTTQLPTVAPRGEEARLGLGVEEAVKVARKTQYKETTGGMLGGSTLLPHEVEIEVSNRLPFAAAIEIRERVPVTEDKDIKIEEVQVKPPWEKDEKPRDGVQTDGARRWQLTVPAGEKAVVKAEFSIKIPGDKMLVGGNRRV